MKTLFVAAVLSVLALNLTSAVAATVSPAPVEPVTVTITATDPTAAEAGPSTGLFTIQRTGSTTSALTVFYHTSGSAVAPGDYPTLPGSIIIPAGAKAATILITPVDDSVIEEDETVIVTLISPIQPLATGTATTVAPLYAIGKPSSATVVIKDNDLGNATLPTVLIRATDPKAAEPTNAGEITISRLGDVTSALIVNYDVIKDPITQPGPNGDNPSVTGPVVVIPAATSGVDYQALPGSITLPPGARSIAIKIQPVDDLLVEGREHVTLRLKPSTAYNINQPDTATVFIDDNDPVNVPPTVSLVEPTDGAKLAAPASITLRAEAKDTDGTIQSVAFLSGDKVIGTVAGPQANNSFSLPWNNVPAGTYTLRAKATDDKGGSTTSAPVKIVVTPSLVPVVTIHATTATVLESDPTHPGTFTVTRTGSLLTKLNVHYTVSGTAANGVDYTQLPGIVTIPAGESSARILVVPIPDNAIEGKETVIVTLTQLVFATTPGVILPPPEELYLVGTPGSATVTIVDFVNVPPKVAITSPKDLDVFPVGTTVKLVAEAADADGQVLAVNFYANDKLIGTAKTAPYGVNWEHATAGPYVLLAKVTDDGGATAISTPVRVTIGPPATPATLVINTPKDGSTFQAPADITIAATAIDPKGAITRVEFYANDKLLGVSEVTFVRAPDPGTPVQHTFAWKAVPAGIYTVIAKAKDSAGAAVSSAPVRLAVLPVLIGPALLPQSIGGGHRVLFAAEIGRQYSIQVSSDLARWVEVGTGVSTDGTLEYVDSSADATPVRFYRALPVPQE